MRYGESCRRGFTTRKIANVEELRQHIVDEWERLDQCIMDGAVKVWWKRLRACAAAEGGQFEHEPVSYTHLTLPTNREV